MKNTEAILVTPKKFEIQETEIRKPENTELLIEVEYVGMCGSDIHGFEFGPFIPPKDPNQKIGLGHEVCGKVVDIGEKVTKFKVGDKVIVEPGVPDLSTHYSKEGRYNICPSVDFLATWPNYKGALTNYMLHPEEWCFKLPENMTSLEGALVEPASVGVHAAKLGNARPGKTILIFGTGCIGLMTLQACLANGASDIIVVDIIDKRLDKALELGARKVLNSSKEDLYKYVQENYPEGIELIFESAGNEVTMKQAVDLVARGGEIIVVGTQSKPVPIDFLKINREVTIKTSFRYCNDFPETIELISNGKIDVNSMVTNIYDYENVQKAFSEAIDSEKKQDIIKGVVKVIRD